MKRIFITFIVTIMCYCGIAQTTQPTINYPPNATGDAVIYQLEASETSSNPPECSIRCSKSPSIETTLEIPSSVIIGNTEYTVTSIAGSGFANEKLFKGDINLPNSITYIGDNAFQNCSGFNGTLFIPVGATLGNKVFEGCDNISSIVISDESNLHTNTFGSQISFNGLDALYLFVPLNELPKKIQKWIADLNTTIITPEDMDNIVTPPTFNPQGCGFTGSIDVTISSEEGATIYYTTNGTTPTTKSTEYTGAITVNATTTIKALAVKEGKTNSQAQATYTKINSIESPTFSPAEGTYNNAQSVTITSATEGATIYYTTDGTTPTTESTPYTVAIPVDGNANIKAIAVTEEGISSVSTVSYYFHAVTPQFSPETNTIFIEGEVLEINISSTTEDATIYYTTDGSDPRTSDTKNEYSEVITLSEAATIKAYAVKEGYEPSEVATATYIEQGTVLTPILSLTPGTYQTAQECTISCGTEGATIYYSINGNEYAVIENNSTISITQNTSISAYAIKEGMADSQVISETYTLIVPTPTINPGGDKYIEAQNVTISAVEGATIYYTTDGTTPTTESTLYTGAITVSEPTTIKATAYVEGWTMSNPATAEYDFYVKLQAPVINEPSGNYSSTIKVTITCENGATIHYTTDGSTPDIYNAKYNGEQISVSPNTTTIIKAIAVKEGMLNSDIATAVYNDNAILTFTGEGSWNNANNWNKGYVPSPEHRVAIAGNVIIEPSDIININYINNLKTDFIPNPGTITIKDGGQLIYKTADIEKVRIEKSITGYGTDPETTQGWYAFSTPIANDINEANYQNLTNGDYDLFSYNEKDWHWHNYEKPGEFSTLNLGQGYLYANSANTIITSVGTPNYNTIEFTLSATANPVFPEDAPNAQNYNLIGFNLIGNPYTYNIGKGDGQAIPNTNLKPGYYTLTTDGQWVSVNDTEPIKVGTSIFVETSNGSIDNGKKITIDNIPYSQATQRRASVNESLSITVANEKYNDVAHINFGNDSEKGLRKIAHMNDDIQMVYVPVNGINYAIANVDNNVNEVPVSFEAYTMGKYTISIDANISHNEVYLLDKLTGEKIDILSQDYTFVATSSDKAERFSLLFVNNNDDDTESTNQIFAYINNGEIIISDIEGSGDVKIYDVMGRLVIAENANGSAKISTESFTNGIYIINLIDGDGIKTQKIAIRK